MENVDVKEEWQDEDFPRCVLRKTKPKSGGFYIFSPEKPSGHEVGGFWLQRQQEPELQQEFRIFGAALSASKILGWFWQPCVSVGRRERSWVCSTGR